jgi:serine/threonine protein kinase
MAMSERTHVQGGTLALSAERRVNAACNRFEQAWQAGQHPRIEDYLGDVAAPERAALLSELVALDIYYRRQAGEAPTADDYRTRFPNLTLASLLADRTAAPQGASQGAAADQPAVPGYEILGELGRGAMGVVYKARQLHLNRVVALKMILAGVHAGEVELGRLHAEAKAIARLQHPHIVQIYAFGEHEGLPYICLEFMGGGSLQSSLQSGPQPAKAAAKLVESLARAMHYAHGQGVIHRDLKPANVLLATDGTVKIGDFGLAKRLGETGLTASGAILGTPNYMAPEQAGGRSKEVGPSADVYALGAILYECLTGRPPFRAATAMAVIQQVLTEEPVPPRLLCADLPAELEMVCLKCLAKEPAERYASAEALAEDLRRFVSGELLSVKPISEREWVTKHLRRAGYEIIDELGRGSMGVVYKARQVSLDRMVALKVLYPLPPVLQTPSEQVRGVLVFVAVNVNPETKQLTLIDDGGVQFLASVGKTQIVYTSNIEDTIQLTVPEALLFQPKELAGFLMDKLSMPAESAETIAQKIVEEGSLHQEEIKCSLVKERERHTRRFRIEAETVGRLQHPNLVQVYDFGEVSGLVFFSMELMEGGALAQRIGSSPQPPH